jgi:hypothetical protein
MAFQATPPYLRCQRTKPMGMPMLVRRSLSAAVAAAGTAAAFAICVLPANAQSPERQGRFGAVTQCTKKSEGFACESIKDVNSASATAEIERLRSENEALKADIRRLEDLVTNDTKADPLPGVTKLPSEKDVDQALDYMEHIYKKLRDRIKKLENEPGNGKTPL